MRPVEGESDVVARAKALLHALTDMLCERDSQREIARVRTEG